MTNYQTNPFARAATLVKHSSTTGRTIIRIIMFPLLVLNEVIHSKDRWKTYCGKMQRSLDLAHGLS